MLRLRPRGKHRTSPPEWQASKLSMSETHVHFTADGPGNDDLRCNCGRLHVGAQIRPDEHAAMAVARQLQWLRNRGFRVSD